MNSLQLLSKIKSKTDDIALNIHKILDPGSALNNIQKELLKKECVDLYELLLKLKTESDQPEDKTYTKNIVNAEPVKDQETPHATPTPPIAQAPEVNKPELVTNNFKDVMNWADKHEETLDAIEQKVEINESITNTNLPLVKDVNKPAFIAEPKPEPNIIEETEVEPKPEPKKEETTVPIEVNVEKAIENKRIQYTVMPAVEEPKPVPLNLNFAEKEISYNEKIAQKIQTNPIPLADKTIEAKIDNLKTAINLNKKIAFVNDLFKENVVEYAKAIDKLNNATDYNEAQMYFTQLKLTYQWQNSNELVQELEKLIKRRYT